MLLCVIIASDAVASCSSAESVVLEFVVAGNVHSSCTSASATARIEQLSASDKRRAVVDLESNLSSYHIHLFMHVCSQLTSLHILSLHSSSEATDNGLDGIYSLPKLTKLYLANLVISNMGLEGISRLTRLLSLKLDRLVNVSNEAMDFIGRLPRLRSFKLDRCHVVTNKGLERVMRMPYLRSLQIADCRGVHSPSLVPKPGLRVRLASKSKDDEQAGLPSPIPTGKDD